MEIVQEAVKKIINTLTDYPPEKNEKLGTYMTNLWLKDCSKYIDLFSGMMTLSRKDIDINGDWFEFGPILRRIMFVNFDYIKKL